MNVERIDKQVKTTYEQYQKIKEFVEIGYFLEDYVVTGAIVTKDIKHNDRINVSESVISLSNDVTYNKEVSFKTKIPNTTYYLDYAEDGKFYFDTGRPSIPYLPIAEITTDEYGNVDTIIDKADPRGGFRLKSDYGLIGYLKNIHDVKDYGAKGDGVTDDIAAIQEAADVVGAAGGGVIYIPPNMHVLISDSIKLHDNTSLIVAPSSTIEIIKGSNKYLVQNIDITNGNENITVIGGKWVGNGTTMTRKFADTLEDSYYGFGFLFHKVRNLKVTDLRIEGTNAWGIAHMNCEYVEFKNLFFWQGGGTNGDGVTGQSSNVIIDNIRGYTNDDLVAVLAYGAQMGSNELLFEKRDTSNISISNIYALSRDSSVAFRAVCAYARAGHSISNLSIKNVYGLTQSSLIKLAGHVAADGYLKNVYISGVNGRVQSTVDAVVEVSNITISTLTISGMNREENEFNVAQIYVKEKGVVQQLIISDVNLKWSGADAQVIYCRGTINNLLLSNITSLDSGGNVAKVLFRNDSADTTTITKIRGNNIQLTGHDSGSVLRLNGGTRASLSCVEFKVNRSILTPFEGDMVLDLTLGPVYYDGSSWKQMTNPNEAFRVYQTTPQTIPAGEYVKVNFTNKMFDVKNNFDLPNSRFIVPNHGIYLVSASVAWSPQVDGNRSVLTIYVNGVDHTWLKQDAVGAATYSVLSGSAILSLNSGDYVEVYVYTQNATNTQVGSTKTYFSMARIN